MTSQQIREFVALVRTDTPADCTQWQLTASPKPIEFEVCRQVLLWLRDHSGLDETWHHPITEIAGVVRGCKAIAESPEPTREGWICRVCGTLFDSEAGAAGCPCPGHSHTRTRLTPNLKTNDPVELDRAGVSMRNLRGEWIKSKEVSQ